MKEETYLKLSTLLLAEEGYRKFPYKDSEGILTIGIGRNIQDKGVSRIEANYLLKNDILDAQDDLIRVIDNFDQLPEYVQIVLLDMAFNMGIVKLLDFEKMLHAVENKDFKNAAFEMMNSKWATQVGYRAKNLAKMMEES
jgi:lysozyme